MTQEVHYIWQWDQWIYIYILCDTFVHFTLCAPGVCFVLEILLYIFPVQEWFFHYTWIISAFVFICLCIIKLCLNWYFVYVIQPNCWLYFILGIFTYISPICGVLSHFVVVTFEFKVICLWMLYLRLLQYVGVLHKIYPLVVLHIRNIVNAYLLYISCYAIFATLVDLY